MPKRNRIRRFSSVEVQGKDSWVEVAQFTIGEIREAQNSPGDAFDSGMQVLQSHVIAWNWVDDNDEPLPQVIDDPTILKQLTNAEVQFLSGCIIGSDTTAKN